MTVTVARIVEVLLALAVLAAATFLIGYYSTARGGGPVPCTGGASSVGPVVVVRGKVVSQPGAHATRDPQGCR